LGCTHFPFVIPTIESIVGLGVRVIDPAPAIARQVERLLDTHGLRSPDKSSSRVGYLTTGDPVKMESLLPGLIGGTAEVHKLVWDGLNLRV
jgi:glutamate racemase